MNAKTRPAVFLFITILGFPVLSARSAPQDKPASLTLDECIVQAVKRNLGVAVQVQGYRLAEIGVTRAAEKFVPSLSFDYYKDSRNSASYSWIEAGDISSSAARTYSAGVSQAVPFGGSLTMSLGTGRNSSNARFQTIDPRYSGSLSFSFTQPLLKDFGWGTSRKEILVARNSREVAENDLKSVLLQTIYAVEQTYWELVYRIESLDVQRQSLKLAEDLLDKSRKEAEIGTLAPKEVISAQAEVASRKADILQAEMLVRDSADSLRGLIRMPFDKDASDIVPADTPAFPKSEIGLDEALATAVRNRPDLQSSVLGIKNKELDFSFAKNQTLPSLSLNAQYWSPGLSGDQILYLDDNPLTGIVVGRLPGSSGPAIRDALHLKYDNWSVALSLDIPLTSVFTRAALAQARTSLDQEIVRMKQTEQDAVIEVRGAVRAVQTNYERVNARRFARELAEEKLAAEEAKLKVGLSNNFYVLNYQRDLAAARTAELRALIDYTLSLGQLDKAMGVSLDKRNIKITDAAIQ
jgi:outer membrane protein TolC